MRFDEGRSNVKVTDFTNSSMPFLILNETRPNYETLLGKNKDSYFNTIFYKNKIYSGINILPSLYRSNNVYFVGVPFILSLKSDPIKYV